MFNSEHNRDFEPEYTWRWRDHGILVQIAKMGGGTVGRRYEGRWLYRVVDISADILSDGGPVVAEGDDFEVFGCGAMNHAMAARGVFDFYQEVTRPD